jgi:Putative zinc-finger
MSDCPNAEIRDLLPDLLHDRLDAPTRARVLAHVDGCSDCRSELELLRSLRGSMERATPRVDVDGIVAALPKPGTARVVAQRPRHISWRIAAAVTFIAVGGTSLVVMRNMRDGGVGTSDSARMRIPPIATETTALVPPTLTSPKPVKPNGETTSIRTLTPRGTTPITPANPREVAPGDDPAANGAIGNHIVNLNEKQLKSLLNEIDHMDATPIIDPEPVVLRVGARATSPTGL